MLIAKLSYAIVVSTTTAHCAAKRMIFCRRAGCLLEAEVSTPVDEVCRKIDIVDAMYYCWCKKYGAVNVGVMPAETTKKMRE